jgi:hypothetical protein
MNARSYTRQYAISVRHPWAWVVVHAGKDVENRGAHAPRLFQAAVGQRVYIHASKSMTTAEWLEAKSFMAKLGVACPRSSDLMYGGIIGSVLVVDIVARIPVRGSSGRMRSCSPTRARNRSAGCAAS